MESNDHLKNTLDRFREYLHQHQLRKTPERFAILETVYSFDGHFTLEELLARMIDEKHFVVSQATVYNTMKILLDAGLVIRHRLSGGTEYEKAVNVGNSHFHLVCSKCGKVREFHDEKLLRALSGIRSGKFCVESYTLYVYGMCSKCSNAQKRRQRKLLEK